MPATLFNSMSPTKKKTKEYIPVIRSLETDPSWQPIAGVCAWLVPGAGHFILGQRKRGIAIGLSICILFLAGIVIGGLGVLDYQQPPEGPDRGRKISFLGVWQPFTSIGAMGCLYKRKVDQSVLFDPQSLTLSIDEYGSDGRPVSPGYFPRYGFSYEIGLLYTAVAGMLNLLAIIDCIFADPKYRRENDLGLIDHAEMKKDPKDPKDQKDLKDLKDQAGASV